MVYRGQEHIGVAEAKATKVAKIQTNTLKLTAMRLGGIPA
jgi:hypothetical protein